MQARAEKRRLEFLCGTFIFLLSLVSSSQSAAQQAAVDTSKIHNLESGYVEVDGGRIFYEAAGHGPAFIMTHDGLLHRETWDAQFTAFASSYRVIRWDRRGYGRSEASKVSYSDIDDLFALVTALKVERAVMIGCSAGGLMTIHFALDHPEKVSALILVGPIVSGMSYSDHFRERGLRGKPGDNSTLTQKIEYWTTKDPWIIAPQNVAAREKAKALLAVHPRNLDIPWQLVRWPKEPALGRLSQIKAPTLLVAGEFDIPDVHSHVGAIEAGIAGAKRVVITNSGHLPHLEVPEMFNKVVLNFLREVK